MLCAETTVNLKDACLSDSGLSPQDAEKKMKEVMVSYEDTVCKISGADKLNKNQFSVLVAYVFPLAITSSLLVYLDFILTSPFAIDTHTTSVQTAQPKISSLN